MTRYGREYDTARRIFKARCREANDPCWLCKGQLGPIDYDSPFDPRLKNSLQFTVDHIQPVSLGGSITSISGMKPAHYRCNVARGNTSRGLFPTSRKW